MAEGVSLERHHRSAGGADVRDPGPYEVLPPDHADLRKVKSKPLSPQMAARVLVPLCKADLANRLPDWSEPSDHGGKERSIVSLAWSALQAAGFKQYVCFVRGLKGHEEIVVVLGEGVTSWPIRQLIPDATDFLEVQAL